LSFLGKSFSLDPKQTKEKVTGSYIKTRVRNGYLSLVCPIISSFTKEVREKKNSKNVNERSLTFIFCDIISDRKLVAFSFVMAYILESDEW
jgi:hypothetical protein